MTAKTQVQSPDVTNVPASNAAAGHIYRSLTTHLMYSDLTLTYLTQTESYFSFQLIISKMSKLGKCA